MPSSRDRESSERNFCRRLGKTLKVVRFLVGLKPVLRSIQGLEILGFNQLSCNCGRNECGCGNRLRLGLQQNLWHLWHYGRLQGHGTCGWQPLEKLCNSLGNRGCCDAAHNLQRDPSACCLAGLLLADQWRNAADAANALLSPCHSVGEPQSMTNLITGSHWGNFLPDLQGLVVLEEARAGLAQVVIDGSCNAGFVPLSTKGRRWS